MRITGENVNYLYDRGVNTKNFPLEGNFYASYGTSTKFKNRIGGVVGRDYYNKKYPLGLNSMVMEMQLKLNDLTDSEAGVLIKSIQSKINEEGENNGYINIGRNNSIPMGTGAFSNVYINLSMAPNNYIYGDISGLYIQDYVDTHKENFLHDVELSLATNARSPFLEYSGVYPDISNISTWSTSSNYQVNDIVYKTGNADPRANFYYCVSDHISSVANQPSDTGIYWTQSFMWQPNFATEIRQKDGNSSESFANGLLNRQKIDKNSNKLNFKLEFNKRSDKETRSILHFLENRMGHKKFKFTVSGIYRSKKYFTAEDWEHEFVYQDVNNVSIYMNEEMIVAPHKGYIHGTSGADWPLGGTSGTLGSYQIVNAEVYNYKTGVEGEGGLIPVPVLRALDEWITTLTGNPTGQSGIPIGTGGVINRIRHFWVPATKGVLGVNVALIFRDGDQIMDGSHQTRSSGKANSLHPVRSYSLQGGFQFDGSGVFNSNVDTSQEEDIYPLGAYIMESPFTGEGGFYNSGGYGWAVTMGVEPLWSTGWAGSGADPFTGWSGSRGFTQSIRALTGSSFFGTNLAPYKYASGYAAQYVGNRFITDNYRVATGLFTQEVSGSNLNSIANTWWNGTENQAQVYNQQRWYGVGQDLSDEWQAGAGAGAPIPYGGYAAVLSNPTYNWVTGAWSPQTYGCFVIFERNCSGAYLELFQTATMKLMRDLGRGRSRWNRYLYIDETDE